MNKIFPIENAYKTVVQILKSFDLEIKHLTHICCRFDNIKRVKYD